MPTIAWTCGDGPLVEFAAGFERKLVGLGYRPGGVAMQLRLMRQLDRWLADTGLAVGDLTPERVEQFLAACRARGQRRVPTLASATELLAHLTELGVIDAGSPPVETVRDRLLSDYRAYLLGERGLTPESALRYQRFAKRFLAHRASRTGGVLGCEGLSSVEINDYLVAASARLVVESAKREAADLRSLLRFLYLCRFIDTDLSVTMPPVATWRGTRLPQGLSAADVEAVLDSCDRSTTSGRRDYALLCLLARLGLRSGEVAALQLGDIDWRRGEIVVRGKARRRDRLPLPVEVGAALAAYLREDRPRCAYRQVILTLYAPPRPIHPSSITNVVRRACRRAGVTEVGGHRLRHALATEMLRRGANLIEIAQVLRHSDLGTTSDYAKIDRTALRAVVRPWPGVRR
jgi:site-specific recombinase XerD